LHKYFKAKRKLLFPLSILLSIILLLVANMIYVQYDKVKALKSLNNDIILAVSISRFVHSTQKERGLSSGYLSNNGKKFHLQLLTQRDTTNRRILHLKKVIKSIKNKKILFKLNQALNTLNKLEIIRTKIDNLQITYLDGIKFYSKLNNEFLNIIVDISKVSKIYNLTQNIIAYSNFLFAKENAGIQRAVGIALISQVEENQSMKEYFADLITIQKVYLGNFLKYTSLDGKKIFNKYFKGNSLKIVAKMEHSILYESYKLKSKYTPEYWYINITDKINKLQQVDAFLEKELLSNIKKELHSIYKLFTIYIIVSIISIIIFITMLYIIATLIKSEKRLKSVIDKYIISSSTDLRGVITDVSDAFCKISGYKRDELIGKPHNIIRHPDMPKSAFRDMWDTISKGKTWNGEVKNLKKDGGYYWVYANIEPLFDRYGKIEGYVAIRLDITDSVHLEEELELSKQKDKTLLHQSKLAQMGEMISMIAHQWRQPLTAISATTADLYIKNMLDQYNSDYYNEKLEKIDSLSQHLSNTIDDFRNFYKQDKEKTEILYCDIIKGAIDIIETTLQNKNIKLEIATNCKKKIYTYPNELRQVILNIIKNAEDVLLERKIENPAIYIKTYSDDTYSYLEISDNAGGIPKNIIDKIFDPYFSTKMKKDGTGLGLYMSQIIVRDHSNGDIIVTNGEDGAIFTLKIPTIKE